MIVLLILALGLSTPPFRDLLKNTSDLAATYQQKCLHSLPPSASTKGALASLICGEKVTDTELKTQLTRTSLIHIFVVSGSHLLMLDDFLGILKIPFFVRWLFLASYSLLVGWQAPAVRALAALSLRQSLWAGRFYFPSDLTVLLAGLLCLTVFPNWWTSLSFQMSWCASLGLTLPSVFAFRKNRLWQRALLAQALVFAAMIPCLWGWGTLHPVGIIINLLVAPLVSFVLLPLAVMAMLSPWGVWLFSRVFYLFEHLLRFLSEPVVVPEGRPIEAAIIWAWIFILHLGCHGTRVYLHRRKP